MKKTTKHTSHTKEVPRITEAEFQAIEAKLVEYKALKEEFESLELQESTLKKDSPVSIEQRYNKLNQVYQDLKALPSSLGATNEKVGGYNLYKRSHYKELYRQRIATDSGILNNIKLNQAIIYTFIAKKSNVSETSSKITSLDFTRDELFEYFVRLFKVIQQSENSPSVHQEDPQVIKEIYLLQVSQFIGQYNFQYLKGYIYRLYKGFELAGIDYLIANIDNLKCSVNKNLLAILILAFVEQPQDKFDQYIDKLYLEKDSSRTKHSDVFWLQYLEEIKDNQSLDLDHKYLIINIVINQLSKNKSDLKKSYISHLKAVTSAKIDETMSSDKINKYTKLISTITDDNITEVFAVILSSVLLVEMDPVDYDTTFVATLKQQLSQFSPDWVKVLRLLPSKIVGGKPSHNSLSTFFKLLPNEEAIDVFLEQEYPIEFKIELFLLFHEWLLNEGDFPYKLRPVLQNIPLLPQAVANGSVMQYLNVTRLYVDVISSPQTENLAAINQLFENDLRQYPEYFAFTILSSSAANKTLVELLNNLLSHWLDIMSPYLAGCLKKYCEVNSNDFIVFLAKYCVNRPNTSIERKISSYLLQLNLLETLLAHCSVENLAHWLKFATEASHQGWSGFELSVKAYYAEHKSNEVIATLLNYLLAEAKKEYEYCQTGHFNPNHKSLSLMAVHGLLELVDDASLSNQQSIEVRIVQKQCLLAYPRLINFGYGHDEAILANIVSSSPHTFPLSVEQQMKEYFQRMYNNNMEITEIVKMLQNLKESNNPYDQDVFACMIHSLLDEYRFFREYPIDALLKTSILFGSLINYHLIDGVTLNLALSFILESARESPESNMFKFAVQALISARPRLPEFPKYCKALYEIQGLKLQPKIFQVIESILGIKAEVEEQEAEEDTVFKSLVLFAIDSSNQETPKEEISDKILFIVNNITLENLPSRLETIKLLLLPSHYMWFSKYLVGSRAKVEPNYQLIYFKLVESLDIAQLSEFVLYETLKDIHVIINRSLETSNDKNYLKNLGSWLGLLTINRNKPILKNYLSLKGLLLESYLADRLTLIVPFVSKVLEKVNQSKIFRPPNPWTLGIVNLLLEIYEIPKLKLQMKFEIEVLLNNLDLKLPELIEENKDRPKLLSTEDLSELISHNLFSGLKLLDSSQLIERQLLDRQRPAQPPQLQQVPQIPQQIPQQPQPVHQPVSQVPQQQLGQGAGKGRQLPRDNNLSIMLENFINNLSGRAFLQLHPNLKRIFQLSFAKAIREVLPPAVDRAVSISVSTANTLILKDFALDGDEIKLRRSAANCVRGVSQFLARVFSRDLLLKHIGDNITTSLNQTFRSDQSTIDKLLLTAISENIESACQLIEIAATEKSIREIDESLYNAILQRRQHKLERPNQQYISPSISKYALSLPQPLGLMPGGVSNEQLQVYEELGRLSLGGAAAAQAPAAPAPAATNVSSNADFMQSITYLQQLLEALLKSLSESADDHLINLADDHPVKAVLNQILNICYKNLTPITDEIYVKVAQFTVNALFTTAETVLSYETLIYLLNVLCELSQSTSKDASWWLVYAEDDRKYNSKIMLMLLKVGLIVPRELDLSLSKAIKNNNEIAIKFAVELIAAVAKDDQFLKNDFVLSVNNLSELKTRDDVQRLLQVLNSQETKSGKSVKFQMAQIFSEWINLLQHNNLNEKLLYRFVYQLYEKGILTNPELMSLLIRTSIEISISIFSKDGYPYNKEDIFISIDGLSKLIIMILVSEKGNANRVTLFKQILTIFTLIFNKDHNENQTFNERPYYRILSTLLSEWEEFRLKLHQSNSDIDQSLLEFDGQFYLVLGDFFNLYQPLIYPGFLFGWLTIISHRMFLPNLLELPNKAGWSKLNKLLVSILKFMTINSNNKKIPEIILVIYRGLLRIFVLIQHDYPEFFVEYHSSLIDNMPLQYLQLRNVVLSSFPKGTVLPNPFEEGLKLESLPGISSIPVTAVKPELLKLKKPVDNYLRVPSHSSLKIVVSGLKSVKPTESGGIGYDQVKVDLKLINALVLYVGIEERKSGEFEFNEKSLLVALLANLLLEEGSTVELQYHILSAVVNQLRYVESYTYWYNKLIVYFFNQDLWGDKKNDIQQLIVRILLERLIVHKPNPWGVNVTLIELIRSNGEFFDLKFIQEVPQLESMWAVLKKYT